MTEENILSGVVDVGARFTRSVALARDALLPEALDGYLLTPAGRDVLGRFAAALRGDSLTRAWSLTGPYGTGKSAFALFAAQLLGGEEAVRAKARKLLSDAAPELADSLFGHGGPLPKKVGRLCPVLVTGSRRPLDKALAAGLAASLRDVAKRGVPPQIVKSLEALAADPAPTGAEVVALYEQANEYLVRFGNDAAGILLVIDELGKFLEYGAADPERGDVFVLQELAEAAARSRRPFLFVTILHQAIAVYADHLSAGKRAEWSKVQGRFEDVAYEERAEQVLRLLSSAIRRDGPAAELARMRDAAESLAREAVALGVRSGSMTSDELKACLLDCHPLHPLAAVVLGPLFRQLAQNERSLFAFLASAEPLGFQDFLRENRPGAVFGLDRLYDYVAASIGPALFARQRGKVWAEVHAALERLHEAGEAEVRLAKCIGLLQALGPACGVPASLATLASAAGLDRPAAEETLTALTRKSVVVFRRHTGSYALWEGSDVDVEERLRAAHGAVERDRSLVAFLEAEAPPASLVARRHYFQTGTMRYLDARYADRQSVQGDLFRDGLFSDFGPADGRVVYLLPRDADERESMRLMLAAGGAGEHPVIAALPRDLHDLKELCVELACVRWVAANTPELDADRTARHEVRALLLDAEQRLRSHLAFAFSPSNTDGCDWYYRGRPVQLSSQRGLNDLASRVCDEAYRSTPHWRNELVNRRALSSSAAAARRNLIEAMIERPTVEGLGITGHPPERSMYETLLKSSRLHRKVGAAWGFHPPDAKADPQVREVWKAVEAFLEGSETGRRPIADLFALLGRQPFGLKDGVTPVILAATLIHHHTQVALYEEGSFVPRPTVAVFERILRAPHKFQLQQFRVAGPRAGVFQQYTALLGRPSQGDARPDLLGIVRPLVRVVKELPEYAGKTARVGETARRILRAVKDARQPDRLLFSDLPAACGFPAFEACGPADQGRTDAYFAALREAFAELRRAYPHLLSEAEGLILAAFDKEGPLSTARKQVEGEARRVLGIAVDAKLKGFLLRVADDSTEDSTWVESIATLLAGKPPPHWDDQDRARFEVQLAAAARSFNHFKVLAFETGEGGALLEGAQAFRVSVTVPNAAEVERVVRVPEDMAEKADRAAERVLHALAEQGLLDRKDVGVAVLGRIVRQLLAEGGGATS